MKRIFTSVFLVLIGACLIKGQVPVSMSVKPGINISKGIIKYPGTDYGNSDYAGHLYTGVNLEFINHSHFSLLAETGFTVKTYDYLYFSPLFKARWEFGAFIPSVFLGPRMDIVVTRGALKEGGQANLNQIIWGTISGLDLEYQFFPFGFLAGFHYQYDITDAYESTKYSWKNSTFVIYLGMKAYFGASPEKNRRGFNYQMF